MGLGFPTNLLTLGNSKSILSNVEDEESEFVLSLKIISFSYLEIARAVLVEVFCSVFIFKLESICSTFSIVLAWEVFILFFIIIIR